MELKKTLEVVHFRCNVCGTSNHVPVALFHRELAACLKCSANARFRGIVWALATELGAGRVERPLVDWPCDPNLHGVGMSDSLAYATPLAEVCNYVNTFLDVEPRLDITKAESPWRDLDFVISSDVLEHVVPPLSRAFDGLAALLRPNGVLILSVPYVVGETNVEHFPDLHDWALTEFKGRRVMINRDRAGRFAVYEDLVFHGGSGATLEFRIFAREHLFRELRASGFRAIREFAVPELSVGYYWPLMVERATLPPMAGYIITARR